MDEIISVKNCLIAMERGDLFACECVTFDHKRRTGGDVMHVLEARLLQREEQEDQPVADRAQTASERTIAEAGRNPNHSAHYTRNIRLHCNGEPTNTIIKIHPPLLISFDGKIVVP